MRGLVSSPAHNHEEGQKMKIIDFERKGNVVRFYLGKDNATDYGGDGWEKYPYDRAERVDEKHITGSADIAFPFDAMVLEPDCGEERCSYSKMDMKKGIVPCVIVVPPNVADGSQRTEFSYWANGKGVLKFYFGDKMNHTIGLAISDFTAANSQGACDVTVHQAGDSVHGRGQTAVPIWEKENLTLSEAALYFGIGQNRLHALTQIRNCNFVLFVGNRRMIKRKAFEKYLEGKYAL